MTELIIDQKIEQLKKITRQDGAHKYAQALYELAEIYHYEKNDIEQAEYYYRLIEKNDNRQAFADAQLQLGQICQYYKKDIKQAEYYYRLVKKNDKRQTYAKAQCQLGNIYQHHKNDIKQAEYYYRLVEKNNSLQAYSQAQLQLGQIYQFDKSDIEQAEYYYQLIEKNDAPHAYAEAQYQLGQIFFYHKNDIEQAEACYRLVEKNDNAQAYVDAQIQLGQISQYYKKDIEQAEACYRLAEKNNSPKAYAEAQYLLGQIFLYHKNDIEQAEACYRLVEKNDSPPAYADAQCQLGCIYQFDKKDIVQAEYYYQLVEKNDSPPVYAYAQCQLGQIYQFYKNDIEQAEYYYQLVEENVNKETFAVAQFQLGMIYQFIKNDIKQAECHYQLVEKNDELNVYTRAQFNLGIIHSDDPQLASKYYLQACDSEEAWLASHVNLQLGNIAYFAKKDLNLQSPKYYYQKVIYTSLSFEVYITAQIMLALLNSGHNHLFENIEEYNKHVIKPICDIRKLTVDIQKQLLVDFKLDKKLNEQEQQFERSVAHYTKPGVLFNLLKNEPSDFRLNVVDFMNDPTENQLLSNWLEIKSDSNNDIKSFLASFSFNHNSLNQFRLYGNENNIVGSSVSIVFNQQFFGSDVNRSINDDSINFLNQNFTSKLTANTDMLNKAKNDTKIVKDNDTTPLHPLSLFRCVYFDPETDYISIAKRNLYSFYLEHKSCEPEVINGKWQDYLDLLDEENKIFEIWKLLRQIRDQIKILKNNTQIQVISNLDQLISLALMPISCLIKHAAFEDEDECRIIYITHIADEKIQAPYDYASANSLFINYAKIEKYIDKIYLGPQCQPYHKLWITNHVRKSNNNSIKVIQSEMPLR